MNQPIEQVNEANSDKAADSAVDDLPMAVVDRSESPARVGKPGIGSRLRVLRFVPLIMLIVAVGGVVGLYFQPPGLKFLMRTLNLEPGGGTSSPIAVPVGRAGELAAKAKGTAKPGLAAPSGKSTVVGLGRLVPRGDVVTVAPPFGAGDARIAELHVAEGQTVKRGVLLATLDNERSLKAAVDTAQAAVASRGASVAQVREAVIASRGEARASLARAEALVVTARHDYERFKNLHGRGFAADAVVEAKRTAFEQAQQDVARAKATLSRYAFVNIEKQADVVVSMRALDAARADLKRARSDLEKAYVRAPSAGTVLTVRVRPGEKPGADGILTLGNIAQMTAEVEVYQTAIGAVKVGDRVRISADALPQVLEGTVSRVGLEVGRQTLTDADPAANTDARVVKVYVTLSPAAIAVARRFTNLQVVARITTKAE